MAELRGNNQSSISPKSQADKAAILAREIVDQHRELSVSSDRAAVEARIKETFIELSREGRIDLNKLVGDQDLGKVRDAITMER